MEHRNRATGWQHAKLSGHKNEDLVKMLLDEDTKYASFFLDRIGFGNDRIDCTSVGGLREKNVPSVTGRRKTKSKTDLKVFLTSGSTINVSVKKSLGGQVYYVRPGIFIDTFEKQFNKSIPASVQRAINLFWASADDAINIIENYADRSNKKAFDLQIKHASLNATTLMAYNKELYYDMLKWFADNSYEIAKLCFSMGAVRDSDEWSDYIWYKNLIGENDVDNIFLIEEICTASARFADERTFYGDNYGGTTIQLPFGFVEWHHGQLQFHHKYNRIISLFE